MDREQDEEVQRITARYVAEFQAGRHPQLDEYLRLYPQHAAAIAEFAVYFHRVEASMPDTGAESSSPSELTATSQAALDRIRQRLKLPGASGTTRITSLLLDMNKQPLTESRLAAELDLSTDIVALLEQRQIAPSTIPQVVLKRLAKVLHQPQQTINNYLSRTEPRGARGVENMRGLKVAEEPAVYQHNQQDQSTLKTFQQAIQQSAQLSEAQKAKWLALTEDEA